MKNCSAIWIPFVLFGLSVTTPATVWSAFKQEAPNSCIDCHKTLDDKRLSRPVQLWENSVHAEVGNTCDGCHGGDPADPTDNAMSIENNFYAAPKQEDIGIFCGKCHQELADNFMTSAHGITNEQTCIDCHGSHTIRRISIQIINAETCSGCHEYAEAEKLRTLLYSMHRKFKDSLDRLIQVKGFPLKPEQKDLSKIWKKLRQVRMISHTFDMPRIQEEAAAVDAMLEEVSGEIDRLHEMMEKRSRWATVTVLIFIGLAFLAFLYYRQNRDFED